MFQGKRCESRRNVERVAAEWRFESQPCATTVLPFLLHHLMVFSIESCGGIAVSKMLGPGNSRPKNWIVVNVDKLLFPALSGLWWIIHPYRWMYCPTQKKHICYIKLLDTPPELLVSAVAGLQQQWTYALDAFLTQRMMSTYLEKLFGPYVSYLLKWPLTKTDSKQPSNVLVINFQKKNFRSKHVIFLITAIHPSTPFKFSMEPQHADFWLTRNLFLQGSIFSFHL